uniref:Peptidase C1A papain C-terminal domain-containing protein n=1 Tax=Daphnia galeata TaxID=27404 RepID=A0A8J2WGC3_9CRUS|nr:unnamed protein product [Daphnia galeata]
MKLLTLFVGLSLVVAFVSSAAAVEDDDDVSMVKFKKFKNRYRKKYNKGALCSYFRRWRNRKKMIYQHNRGTLLGNSSFTLVDNKFADETDDEWKNSLGLVIPGQFNFKKAGIKDLTAIDPNKSGDDRQVISSTITIPASFDLRKHRCMPPVKSQITCGACWAFIATTSVEFQSCGQVTNATYPYKAAMGTCQYRQGVTKVSGRISRYIYLDSNERTILSALLQRGPITVSIVANPKFILYSLAGAGKIIHRPTELDETSKTFFAMKLIAVYLMSLAFFVVISAAIDDPDDEEMIKFKEFKKRNKKKYNGALERVHFKRWKKRRAVIRRHNNGTLSGGRNSSFKMGDNLFADQSEEEWETYLLGVTVPEEFISMNEEEEEVETTTTITDLEMENTTEEINEIDDRQTAPSLDLRNHPCMPPIKFQAPCGGCWAFIATTAVEYQTCLRSTNKTALTLSEQQLIDCSGSYGTKGCNGGFYSQAWDYIMANGGLTTNATYPYSASTTGACNFTKGVTPVAGRISRYAYLAKNEANILTALTRGPIAVSIVANSKFILYSSTDTNQIHFIARLFFKQATHNVMKWMTICFLSLAITVGFSTAQDESEEELTKFKEFKKKHKKSYTGALERVHLKRWKKRKTIIEKHNNDRVASFNLGDNPYADLSEEEWDTYLLGVRIPKEFVSTQEVAVIPASNPAVDDRQTVPSLDLRNDPCMPPVKIQSPCGGCWAFIATTAVEYQTCINNNASKTPLLLRQIDFIIFIKFDLIIVI